MGDICDACGGELKVGDWPFCRGDSSKHVPAPGFGDEPLDYIDVQLLDRNDPRCDAVNELGIRGVHITSRGQRREIMRELGLQYGSQKFEDRGKKLYFT